MRAKPYVNAKGQSLQPQENVFPQWQQHTPPATTRTADRALHAVAERRLAANPLVTENKDSSLL